MNAAVDPVWSATSEGNVLVPRSVTGRCWVMRGADDRAGLALAQRLGLPEVVGRVMAARGIGLAAGSGNDDSVISETSRRAGGSLAA